MKLLITVTLVATISFAFVSCKKDNSGPAGTAASIQGNWTFLGFHAETSSTNIIKEGSTETKAVTTSTYDTRNNAGDFVIDGSKFNYANLGYSIEGIAHSQQYTNGTLESTNDFPVQFTVQQQNGSAPYRVAGADSIYFSAGSFVSDGNIQATQPSGAKIKIEGDKLIITQSVNQTIKSDQGGNDITAIVSAVEIVTLQKK